jgi:hypothetical protein
VARARTRGTGCCFSHGFDLASIDALLSGTRRNGEIIEQFMRHLDLCRIMPDANGAGQLQRARFSAPGIGEPEMRFRLRRRRS